MNILKAVDGRLLRVPQSGDKGLVFLLVHGAVDVVRRTLVVAGAEPRLVHVDAVKGDEGRGRVVEVQKALLRTQGGDGGDEALAGQGPRGDDAGTVGKLCDLALQDLNVRLGPNGVGDGPGKGLPVHCQGTPRGDPVALRAHHDEAVQAPQLLFEKAHGVGEIVPPQGVGAHQLREEGGGGATYGPGSSSPASSHTAAPYAPGSPAARPPRCPRGPPPPRIRPRSRSGLRL